MATNEPRPLTRAQQRENAAFIAALRETGNAREAARRAGIAYGTVQHRRRRHATFDHQWQLALAFAHAQLGAAGLQGPRSATGGHRTVGGETVVVRRRDGRPQVRRAQPGKLTDAALTTFLSALSASANVRLAAAAAGAAQAAFYRRRRQSPGFAREWGLALAQGYETIELALIAASDPDAFAHDDWRRNDPPAMPPLTPNQALQLLYLHQKEVRLGGTPEPFRRRPGEPEIVRDARLVVSAEAVRERQRQQFRVAEAERLARGEPTYLPWGTGDLPPLDVDLAQVTGWSRASGRPPADPDTALFGGWRLRDIPADRRRR